LKDTLFQIHGLSRAVRSQLEHDALHGALPFQFPSDKPQNDSRWVEVTVNAIERVFGDATSMANLIEKVSESCVDEKNSSPTWGIVCHRFADDDSLALQCAESFFGCRYGHNFSQSYWSMMQDSVRERRSYDAEFVDKMIYMDPSDRENSPPFAAINIVGNQVLMDNPHTVLKALKVQGMKIHGYVRTLWRCLKWETLRNDELRNFFLRHPDTQQNLVLGMVLGKIDSTCQTMVSTPQFVIKLITDDSVPVQTRYDTYRFAIGTLPKNDYHVAVEAMMLFGVDTEGGIADPVEARLLQIVAKNHMDAKQRLQLENGERNRQLLPNDHEGNPPGTSRVEGDVIFLRSLLYDLRKYFTPEVEYEVLDGKPFARGPPSNYKRVIFMAEVKLEEMTNDFQVKDEPEAVEEGPDVPTDTVETGADEDQVLLAFPAPAEEDAAAAAAAEAGVQLKPASLKSVKELLDRYATAASMITRTAQRFGNYNDASEVVEDFKGLAVVWSLPAWEKEGRERSLAEIDNNEFEEGVYRLRTKNGRTIALPEEITSTMPPFEFSGVLWPGYGDPPQEATRASRVAFPTTDTYKNITLIVTDVANDHPALWNTISPSLSDRMDVITDFNATLPWPTDAPKFVQPIEVHNFTTDENLQTLKKDIHRRGGSGIKTFDARMKGSKVDRHAYSYYSTAIVDFIERPTLLGALRTLEDTEGAMSFYETSKIFAEGEKEARDHTPKRKRRRDRSSGTRLNCQRTEFDSDIRFGVVDTCVAPAPAAAASASSSAYLSGAFDQDSDSDAPSNYWDFSGEDVVDLD